MTFRVDNCEPYSSLIQTAMQDGFKRCEVFGTDACILTVEGVQIIFTRKRIKPALSSIAHCFESKLLSGDGFVVSKGKVYIDE